MTKIILTLKILPNTLTGQYVKKLKIMNVAE